MTNKTRYLVVASMLVTLVGLGTGLVAYYVGFQPGSLVSQERDELRYVSSQSAGVAFVNVRQLMTSTALQRVRRTFPAHDGGQHEFERQTGINVETDIEHVVASLDAQSNDARQPGSGMALAKGTFNEVRIESLMRDQGARVESYRGKRVLVTTPQASAFSGDPASIGQSNGNTVRELAVSFLKPGLVGLGSVDAVRRAIDVGSGEGAPVTANDEVMRLITAVDSSTVWAVGRFDALRSAGALPQPLNQLPAVTWFSISGHVNDGISAVVQAEARDDGSAANLRDVIRGFMALAKLQTSQNPGLESVMQSIELGGAGKTVAVSFTVSGQALDLIGSSLAPSERKSAAH